MGKLFGTDGIRGIVNESLDGNLAFRVGQAAAAVLAEGKAARPRVILGKDTRLSSDLLEGALIAGLCSGGADVITLGVVPTPAVSYLTVVGEADAGVMISASHNSFEYNGIKIFGSNGQKLSDEAEGEIEARILSRMILPMKTGAEIGSVRHSENAAEYYLRHLTAQVREPLEGLRVLVDCANGSASKTARRLFGSYQLDVQFIHDKPDGININRECGSTHLASLSEQVVRRKCDLGIAFDGDADRCLAVDEKGREIDGDKIMAVCAEHMLARGTLKNGGFVGTVMSNLGLHRYCRSRGLKLLCAPVGDRYVLEMMQREGMSLGGEQSGHIIFLDEMPTGDGQLSALHFLQIVCQDGRPVSEIVSAIPRYPQVLLGTKASLYVDQRRAALDNPALRAAVQAAEEKLGDEGRVLIRPSGTEALIRVMVEAQDQDLAQNIAESLVSVIRDIQN